MAFSAVESVLRSTSMPAMVSRPQFRRGSGLSSDRFDRGFHGTVSRRIVLCRRGHSETSGRSDRLDGHVHRRSQSDTLSNSSQSLPRPVPKAYGRNASESTVVTFSCDERRSASVYDAPRTSSISSSPSGLSAPSPSESEPDLVSYAWRSLSNVTRTSVGSNWNPRPVASGSDL